MIDKKKLDNMSQAELTQEAYRLNIMPACYKPCPPFFDVCNHAFNFGHDDKCQICFEIFKLEDSIE